MADAEVGDDVFDEDPTMHRLQDTLAEMLGKEAALFVPSGTMSNQIGVRIHCKAGDEFLCEENCHIFQYEQGAFAQLSGLVARTVLGEAGVLRREQLTDLVRGGDDHVVETRLVSLENTHNRGGGRIFPLDEIESICTWAHQQGLATHLDGARLFNAVAATGIEASEWASHFDTVSVCFSKGLGAPVGSALAGPKEMIREARRHRKLFGGGMRQAGVIAAGALYALENHVERLVDDHAAAQVLAEAVDEIDGLTLRGGRVDTNIVIFEVDPALGSEAELVERLEAEGVLAIDIGPRAVRLVTHLDVTLDDAKQAADVLRRIAVPIGAH